MQDGKESARLSSNMEDYLECIAAVKKDRGVVRVKDVSQTIGVRASSVTVALNVLSRKGLVVHERYGYVELTPEGENVAEDVQKRHDMLTKFLSEILKIDARVAEEDACKIEHSISYQTFSKLTKFIEFVETCPESKRPDWLESFDYYSKTGKRRKCKTRKLKEKLMKK